MIKEEINSQISELPENEKGEISDGFHTFNELYNHRKYLNALLFNKFYRDGTNNVHKSKRHSDGELCFGGEYFIVLADLDGLQISYHYPLEDWDLFICSEKYIPLAYDGHTSKDVEERLLRSLKPQVKSGLISQVELPPKEGRLQLRSWIYVKGKE